jgi:hypothetical protein
LGLIWLKQSDIYTRITDDISKLAGVIFLLFFFIFSNHSDLKKTANHQYIFPNLSANSSLKKVCI